MDGVNHSEYWAPTLLKAVILSGRNDQTGRLFGPGRTWLTGPDGDKLISELIGMSG